MATKEEKLREILSDLYRLGCIKGQRLDFNVELIRNCENALSQINQLFSEGKEMDKDFIQKYYEEFLRYYYNAPCNGCKEGHSSFWRTICNSEEWKKWTDSNPHYDIPECEELGVISEKHWKDFVKFIIDDHIVDPNKMVGKDKGGCDE